MEMSCLAGVWENMVCPLMVLWRRAMLWKVMRLLWHVSPLLWHGTELLLLRHRSRALLEPHRYGGLTSTLRHGVMRWCWGLAHGATALLGLEEFWHHHKCGGAECAKARGRMVIS